MTGAAEVEAYLAARSPDEQTALRNLRAMILARLPEAEERISYSMPGMRFRGKMVAGYAAFSRHMSFFPHSGSVVPAFASELKRLGHGFTKSGVHFTADRPLSSDLLDRLIAARLAELD